MNIEHQTGAFDLYTLMGECLRIEGMEDIEVW